MIASPVSRELKGGSSPGVETRAPKARRRTTVRREYIYIYFLTEQTDAFKSVCNILRSLVQSKFRI